MSHTNQGYWLANPIETDQQYNNPWLNNPIPTNTRTPTSQQSQQTNQVYGVYQGMQQTTERPNWMGQQTIAKNEFPQMQNTWTPWVSGQQTTIPDWGMFAQPASTRGGNQELNINQYQQQNQENTQEMFAKIGLPEYKLPPRGSATR